MKKKIKKFIGFILNPRLILSFGLAWIITNGWAYILLGIGTFYEITWMVAVAGSYLAFLWLPMTPEKILTCILSIAILRLLFPKDEKTLAILRHELGKAKAALRSRKEHKKKK